jgi:hypothetical protein
MEDGQKYFVAKIAEDLVDSESGKIKKIKLEKLVLGYTPTDVEAKVTKIYEHYTQDWRITAIVLGLFTLIIVGINAGVFLGASIGEDWKEMLLILLGAFVGNLNKVVDYWFNSEDRDKMLIQKVDEEDGVTLSDTAQK